MDIKTLTDEFDRQVGNLITKGYPKAAGITDADFSACTAPLREQLNEATFAVDLENGTLPFVLVVNEPRISAETMMAHIAKDGKKGVTALRPLTSNDFKTMDNISLPDKAAYLLMDIDRGKGNINLPPRDALQMIRSAGRTPLTVNEGIAIVTQYPDFLRKNNCFSLLASRTGTDQRVPAIWINARKEPNLGWCWDGNPHSWLGSASCSRRIG